MELARLEDGKVPLLRHDFRACYHVRYEDVCASEAVDLIKTLPSGSLYVRETQPARAWPEWREALADMRDDMRALVYALRGIEDFPHVVRPADIVLRAAAADRSASVRERIEQAEWEEA